MPTAVDITIVSTILGPLVAVVYFCSIQPRRETRRREKELDRQAMAFDQIRQPKHVKVHAPRAGSDA